MDGMDLEREKGITIQSAATYCNWDEHHFNVIDTPGHVDFTIEVERALRVLDGAIMVVCSVGGVQAQTLTVHRQMCRYNVPRIIFINKMDRFGADPVFCMKQIREKCGLTCALVQVPIGAEDKFEGVIDVIRRRAAYFYGEKGEKREHTDDIPAELVEQMEKTRSDLIGTFSKIPFFSFKFALKIIFLFAFFKKKLLFACFKNITLHLLIETLADLDDEIAELYLEGGDVHQLEINYFFLKNS